jgi:two-component system, chemotaxis family, protein-glutamate methylesterase/glutaminase
MEKIKVLCVDDSALMRKIMREILDQQPDMEVVGCAANPYIAREMIKQRHPHVLTLDIEMPRMDGLSFLEKIMRLRPMPVIMVSTLTTNGSQATLRALELGAVDFVTKQTLNFKQGVSAYANLLSDKIRVAAKANIIKRRYQVAKYPKLNLPLPQITNDVIAIGASTGGTEAIRHLLQGLPQNIPAIVVAQHMPAGFTRSFAERLNRCCFLQVKEAEQGEKLLAGHVYIAPGNFHLALTKTGRYYQIVLHQQDMVNHHRPSVDNLFFSVAQTAGKRAIGMILTGMGNDGAMGLLAMRQAGAYTFAQNEKSCVVYGMPKVALQLNAVDEVGDINDLGRLLLDKLEQRYAV